MFCRLCLHKSETENFTTIFVTTTELKWQDLISRHLDLKINHNDAHSTAICEACSKKLKEFHEFYQLVRNRQMLLSEIEANVQTSTKAMASKALSDSSIEEDPSTMECVPINIKQERPEALLDNLESIKAETFNEDYIDASQIEFSGNELPTASDKNTKTVEENLEQHICVVCKKILISSVALKKHIDNFHMKPFVYKSSGLKRKYQATSQDDFRNAPNTTITDRNALQTTESRDEVADRTCIICNKTFKRMSTLLAHMKKFHTGVHPFECSNCGVKFLTHRGLGSHFQISKDCAKVNQTVESNSNQKELNFAKQLTQKNVAYRTCNVCKTLFENWKYLEKHMYTKHDGIEHFLCKSCGKTFLLRLNFHNHLKSTPTCINPTTATFDGL